MLNSRIYQLRKEKGLSQEEFGEKLNVSGGLIGMYEKGTRKPTERVISDICRVYEVNRKWLEFGVGEPFKEKTRKDELKEQIYTMIDMLDDEEIKIMQNIVKKIRGI